MDTTSPTDVVTAILREIRSLDPPNTPNLRRIRLRFTRLLRDSSATDLFKVSQALLKSEVPRWVAYELLQNHDSAFQKLGASRLRELGDGMEGWHWVDGFARVLSGPAWLRGQISDRQIERWAHSHNLWWRRAALVSTVALNTKSDGGQGDSPRTLKICRLLVADHNDMIVKALSWALRSLVGYDPGAVKRFLADHEDIVASRAKREVCNKLITGRKNPRIQRQ